MAKKILLKDQNDILIPVTRGELVLDSSGNQALHSSEFLATDSQPGLTTIHYVNVNSNSITETFDKETNAVQLKSLSENIYPITSSDNVIVVSNTNDNKSLTNVLNEIQINVENSKTILDDRPTEGNTTHGVSSDGIFQELKETVGNIQILLQNV